MQACCWEKTTRQHEPTQSMCGKEKVYLHFNFLVLNFFFLQELKLKRFNNSNNFESAISPPLDRARTILKRQENFTAQLQIGEESALHPKSLT